MDVWSILYSFSLLSINKQPGAQGNIETLENESAIENKDFHMVYLERSNSNEI
jgi:hypothetical protein